MLVCNVSQRARRAAIIADIAEAALALDSTTQGHVVFATLVDDPANVRDRIDAYLGEIMLETAAAACTVNAGLVYAASIVEASTAADLSSASIPGVFSVAAAETAAAASSQDAAVVSAAMRTAAAAGLEPMIVSASTPRSSRLRSGLGLTVQ